MFAVLQRVFRPQPLIAGVRTVAGAGVWVAGICKIGQGVDDQHAEVLFLHSIATTVIERISKYKVQFIPMHYPHPLRPRILGGQMIEVVVKDLLTLLRHGPC